MAEQAKIYKLTHRKEVPSIFKNLSKLNHKKRIKIRYKPIGTRNIKKNITQITGYSLYLDYWHNGKHEYQFLKLYIKGKKNTENEDKNNLQIVIGLRDKKELELLQSEYDFKFKDEKRKINFIDYFKALSDKKNDISWENAYKHLFKFSGDKISFNQIDAKFCESFKDYLLNTVSVNSAHHYLSKLKAALNQAVKEEIISKNPAQYIQVKKEETEKEYLTEVELQLLINTPYEMEQIKSAFLFSCLTGVRFSDIKSLTFSQIRAGYIHFKQQKTSGVERLKLSNSAIKIIDMQKKLNDSNLVFKLPASVSNILKHLKIWLGRAGINRNVTFHSGRHTFAIMALNSDMDIYTLSKLLGHKNLKTTQIYAKIVDKKKDEAIDKLPEFEL
jgi:integrase